MIHIELWHLILGYVALCYFVSSWIYRKTGFAEWTYCQHGKKTLSEFRKVIS